MLEDATFLTSLPMFNEAQVTNLVVFEEQKEDRAPGIVLVKIEVWFEQVDVFVVHEVLYRECKTKQSFPTRCLLSLLAQLLRSQLAGGWHAPVHLSNNNFIGRREETGYIAMVLGCLLCSGRRVLQEPYAISCSVRRGVLCRCQLPPVIFVEEVQGDLPYVSRI